MSDFSHEIPSHHHQIYANTPSSEDEQLTEALKIYTNFEATKLNCYTSTLDRIQAENRLLNYCKSKNVVSPVDYFLVRYSTSSNTVVIMLYELEGFVNHVFRYRISSNTKKPVIYFNDKKLFYNRDVEFKNVFEVIKALEQAGYNTCIIK